MRIKLSVLWIAAAAAGVCGAAAGAGAPADGVYIVGSLHRLHATEPVFGFEELRRVIEEIDPDVMLLEVRPDELAERMDTPGRPEYPRIVWPLLDKRPRTALPMEPNPPLFTEMVDAASAAFADFKRRDAEGYARWDRIQDSYERVLQAYWADLKQTHDNATDDLARSYYQTQTALVGANFGAGQLRWDGYMVERAREAVRANPGKRILVLGSYRNRHVFDEALRREFSNRVVDMEQWLGSRPAERR